MTSAVLKPVFGEWDVTFRALRAGFQCFVSNSRAHASAKSHPVFFTFFGPKKLEKFTKVISSVNLGKLCPVHMQDEWSFASLENLGKIKKDAL